MYLFFSLLHDQTQSLNVYNESDFWYISIMVVVSFLFLLIELILLKTRLITRFIYTVFCETKRQPAKLLGRYICDNFYQRTSTKVQFLTAR